MFKKIRLLISCFSIIGLAACANSDTLAFDVETVEFELSESANMLTSNSGAVTISIATVEIVNEVESNRNWVGLDFAEATGGFITEGVTLLFTVNEHILDFTIADIVIDEFWTGEQLLLTNFPLGQSADLIYTLRTAEKYAYEFAVNIDGEIGMLLAVNTWQIPEVEAESSYDTAGIREHDSELSISYMDGLELEYTHSFDYNMVSLSRLYGIDAESPMRASLLIKTTTTIHDVALVSVHLTMGDELIDFTIADTIAITNVLEPTDRLAIYNYFSNGTIPASGLTFIDELGVQHYYLIHQDNSDSDATYRLIPFFPIVWN